MRVITGNLGGRVFTAPKGSVTHPMSDKIRGGLFNVLGDIEGLSLLDAFAGSGAVSFEAISRGAASALAIDSDKNAQNAIAKGIQDLGLSSQLKLIKANAGAWLNTTNDQFDVVICDPPYVDLQPGLLKRLSQRVKGGGVVVLSLPPTSDFKLGEGFELLTRKDYGDAQLVFYRRNR